MKLSVFIIYGSHSNTFKIYFFLYCFLKSSRSLCRSNWGWDCRKSSKGCLSCLCHHNTTLCTKHETAVPLMLKLRVFVTCAMSPAALRSWVWLWGDTSSPSCWRWQTVRHITNSSPPKHSVALMLRVLLALQATCACVWARRRRYTMRFERRVRRCGSVARWRPGSLLVHRTVSTSWLYLLLNEGAETGQCFCNTCFYFVKVTGSWYMRVISWSMPTLPRFSKVNLHVYCSW